MSSSSESADGASAPSASASSSPDPPFVVRNATREEVVGHFASQASIEKWNPGLHDSACHWEFDPNGFFVAVDKGEPSRIVGCILGAKGGEKFGFVGYFIVLPGFRKRGCGTLLMKHALAYLSGRTVALDAVLEQIPFYEKYGFSSSFTETRFSSTVGDLIQRLAAHPKVTADSENGRTFSFTNENDSKRNDTVSKIVAYDASISPVPREKFLRAWLTTPEVWCGVAEDDASNKVVGYVSIRKSDNGWRMNPLFADSKAVALQLLKFSLASLQVQIRDLTASICIDAPRTNHIAVETCEELHMAADWSLRRMYRGDDPQLDTSRVFGMTAPESQLL